MIGLSVLLFILERMLEGETPESFITAVCHALILEKGLADAGICVNMLMEYLSAGCTQLSIGQGSAKMVPVVTEGCAFLLTYLKSFVRCMCPLDLLFLHLDQLLLLLMSWTWLLQ
jgi:hypothetical protein